MSGATGSDSQPLPKAAARLATMAFALPPLERVAGWHFGKWNTRDPRARIRHRLWWWARRRYYDGPLVTPWYMGQRFFHHLTGDMSFCTYVDGRYEPNEMFAVAQILRPGMTFVDVGANEGIFTMLGSASVGPQGRVHAFEPSPRERARLEANLELNLLRNVRVHALALGGEPRTARLFVADAQHSGHNTLGGFSYEETQLTSTVEVQVQTLDDFVAAEGLDRVDLIKVDVEGSETAVIRGAEGTLRRLRPTLLIEAQESSLVKMGSGVAELLDLIRGSDYTIEGFDATGEARMIQGDQTESLNVLCRPN